ncbi:MAG: ABC transporter permease [Anaerolineae bacterium]|nr:ABC transporter permease [Anaerolineae bacterium]
MTEVRSPWPLILMNFAILVGGMLIAVWIRLRIAIGMPLGEDYRAQNPELYIILAVSILLAYGFTLLFTPQSLIGRLLAPWRQFRILIMALLLSTLLVLVLLPDISQLQIIYYVIGVILVGGVVVVLPARMRATAYTRSTTLQDMREIYDKRFLVAIWLRYTIQSRYNQTILGILWIVLLPLSMSFVMAFAFTQLLGRTQNIGVPFVVFLLSGQIFFSVFSHVVMNSKSAILGTIGIIKQVYFPREVIIILIAGEALVDFTFTFVAFIVISLFFGVWPNIYYILLPIPLLLMLCLSLGVGFIVSWLSMIIRDMQQLIGVLMQLLFYVTVLFSSQSVDPRYEFLMSVNPVSALVEAFRDITLYGRVPDPVRLYLPTVISLVVLYFGYVLFKVNEDRFVDYS